MQKFLKEKNNLNNFEYLFGKIDNKNILDIIYNEKSNLIIINPPIKGLDKNVICFLKEVSSKYLFYVSCNPVFLTKEFKIFNRKI